MKIKIAAALAAMMVLAGCASNPEDIAPLYTSDRQYEPFTCEQLDGELRNLNTAISVASQQQSRARNSDIAGVLLVGLPVGSMTGRGAEMQVATLKGHYQAASRVMIAKKCPSAAILARP